MNFFVFKVLAAFAATTTAIVHNEQLASVASTRQVGISGAGNSPKRAAKGLTKGSTRKAAGISMRGDHR